MTMIRSDWTLRTILAALFLGLAMTALGLVYTTFLKSNEANAKTYVVTKFGLCNAFLPSGTKPWCAEVRKDGSEYHLAVTK
jgi:hypothetical protein